MTAAARRSPRRRRDRRAAAATGVRALLAGLCIAASMPPWGWWPMIFVGVLLLDRLIAGQPPVARARRGWLVGLGWMLPANLWMADLSIPGYVAAGMVLALPLAAACALVPPDRWRWLALPGAIGLAEFVRWSVPFGGIPLATVPMSQAASPLGPIVRLGGGVGLTMVVVAGAVAVSALVAGANRAGIAALAAVGMVWGLAAVAPRGHAVGELDVAVVQGGGPQRTRAVDTDERAVFERHLQASAVVRTPVDLVLWPENVVNVEGPIAETQEGQELAELAQRLGATVVPGIVESFPDHFLNASIAIDPRGRTVSRYDKVQRVPFGEYVPFRSIIDPLSGGAASKFIPRDARKGQGPAILDTPVGRVGVVISWEVFFERRARDAIGHGGEVLLNPTNGSSYWLTMVQSQQVASSRLRALETDRWVAQAAPTGFSAIIRPTGEVVERSGISEAKVIQQRVERRTGDTLAVRLGPWPALAVAMALLAAAQLLAGRQRVARRRADEGAAADMPDEPNEPAAVGAPAATGVPDVPGAPSPGHDPRAAEADAADSDTPAQPTDDGPAPDRLTPPASG